jgi:hypothetical protein
VRALPYALRSVSPVELSERLQAERLGVAFLLHLDGDGRQRIVPLGDVIMLGHTLLAFFAGAGADARATATVADLSPPPLSPAQRRVLTALCRPLLEDTFAGPPSNRQIAASS